jgi:hypothetical protein
MDIGCILSPGFACVLSNTRSKLHWQLLIFTNLYLLTKILILSRGKVNNNDFQDVCLYVWGYRRNQFQQLFRRCIECTFQWTYSTETYFFSRVRYLQCENVINRWMRVARDRSLWHSLGSKL